MKIPNSKENFSNQAAEYMIQNHNIPPELAYQLMAKYIDEINVNDVTTQQLGSDYFAIQILMAEELIPYQPM